MNSTVKLFIARPVSAAIPFSVSDNLRPSHDMQHLSLRGCDPPSQVVTCRRWHNGLTINILVWHRHIFHPKSPHHELSLGRRKENNLFRPSRVQEQYSHGYGRF